MSPGTPLWYADFMFFLFPAWLALGMYWLTRMIVATRLTGRATVQRRWVRWAPPPLIIVGMMSVLLADGPRWVRFTRSEPGHAGTREDDHRRRNQRRLPLARALSQLLGHARAGRHRHRDRSVLADIGFMQTEGPGFAWIPSGRLPPADSELDHSYFPLAPRWWAWSGWGSL